MAEAETNKFIDLELPGSRTAGSVDSSVPQFAAPAHGGAIGAAPAAASSGSKGGQLGTWIAASKHPRICVFHLLFKFVAFISYIGGRHIAGDYVLTFILTVIFP